MNTTVVLFCCSSLGISAACRAQLPVTAYWETSRDAGLTWDSGDVVVPQTTGSVLVRLRVGWDPSSLINPSLNWYADCRFDAVVVGVGSAGAADTASNYFAMIGSYWNPLDGLAAHRQRNVLKIDPSFDDTPPGQGYGIGPHQNPAVVSQTATLDNPVRIFQYELLLDGTLGRRDVYGLWLPSPTGEPINFRVWEGLFQPRWATSLVNVPASITVVPSPSVGVVLAAGFARVVRRRR